MYSVFNVKMCLRNFHLKVEFVFEKRVIVAHKPMRPFIPVIYLYFSILEAIGYVRHINVVQNTKIELST